MQQCCCGCYDCPLRRPQPSDCIPCKGPRNPVCFCDKQPKIVGSLLGYFCIDRQPKNDYPDGDICLGLEDPCKANYNGDDEKYKGWVGRHLYNPCREQRNYKLRFTTSGVYGRGFNNTYRACSSCGCGSCCECDLYSPRMNDRY